MGLIIVGRATKSGFVRSDGESISNNEQGIPNIEVLGNQKKGVFEVKGRVVGQKNRNESIRQAQDRFTGFFNRSAGPSFLSFHTVLNIELECFKSKR